MSVETRLLKPKHHGLIQLALSIGLLLASGANYAQPNAKSQALKIGIQTGLARLYPEYNGLALAYNIPKVIFTNQGYDITAIEYPGKRLPLTVAHGDVDLSLASKFSLEPYGDKLISAELPVAVLTYKIYYNSKDNWTPVWPPDDRFKHKVGKSKISSVLLANRFGLNISQARTVDSIVKMVNVGRIDYWLEYSSSGLLVTPGLINRRSKKFNYQALFSLPTYIYFQNTKRGRLLKKIYDQGLLALFQQGEFVTTYFSQMPPDAIDSTILTLAYIRQKHPELQIPQQHPLSTLKHSPQNEPSGSR